MVGRFFTIIVFLASCAAQAQAPNDPLDLWTQATLYRDEWGVPHVYAQNYRALAFAFGYAQAEDHAQPMLLAYRVVNGRAAAVAGEPMAASDEYHLRMGHERLAQRALQNADPVTLELCEGFALGVNAWIMDHAGALPDWVEGVRPQDVLALWHAYITGFAPLDLPKQFRPPAAGTGNAWAVAPARTENGKTLLVMNPHEYYDGPFRWCEAHLATGDYDVHGATLFGLPVLLMGYNGSAGWGLTPNRPDFADVFEEDTSGPQRNPKDPRYSAPNPLEENAPALMYYAHAQPYYVKTAAGMETRYAPSYLHARGPVFEHSGSLFSWTVGGYFNLGGLLQMVEMGRARELAAFQQALSLEQIPCFNVIFADAGGNIFHLYNATAGTRDVPPTVATKEEREQGGINWRAPQPGARAPFAWGATVPVGSLPYISNPESGYVQACGTPPWLSTESAPIDPAAVPYWLVSEKDTFRARRVRQLLQLSGRSPKDMQAMLYDTLMPAAVELSPVLLKAAHTKGDVTQLHPDLPPALGLLEGWHHVAEVNSAATTFYHAWWTLFREGAQSEVPEETVLYDSLMAGDPKAIDAALNAAAAAARSMRNEFNTTSVPWGDVHRIRRGAREEPLFGAVSGDPIFLSGDFAFTGEKWLANYGYGFAMAVELGPQPIAYSISPFGTSEDPQSPHFDDQLDLFLAKRMKRARYLPDDVLRNASTGQGRAITLYPKGVPAAIHFFADSPIESRLETTVEAPAALPAGTAPASLFVRAEVQPEDASATCMIEMHLPESLALAENIPRIALYEQRPGGPWTPLEDQQLDFNARVFTATARAGATFALLGPQDAIITVAPEEAKPLVADAGAAAATPPLETVTVEAPAPELSQPSDLPATPQEAPEKIVLDGPVPPLAPEGAAFAAPAQDSPADAPEPQRKKRKDRKEGEFPPGLVFGPASRGETAAEPTPAPAPAPPNGDAHSGGEAQSPEAMSETAPAAQPTPAPETQAPPASAPELPANLPGVLYGPAAAPSQTSGPGFPQLRNMTPVGKQDETRVFTFKPGQGFKELTGTAEAKQVGTR